MLCLFALIFIHLEHLLLKNSKQDENLLISRCNRMPSLVKLQMFVKLTINQNKITIIKLFINHH